MNNIFVPSRVPEAAPTPIDAVVEKLKAYSQSDNGIGNQSLARAVVAAEGLREEQLQELEAVSSNLNITLEEIAQDLHIEGGLTTAQKNAASVAGIIAGNPEAVFSQPRRMQPATENMDVVDYTGVADAFQQRAFSLEAYDNRENRNAAMFSIAYNMQAARQDEFGETFYPTVVVAPDNVGFGVTVRLIDVYNGITRSVTGALADFNRINIIRALADHTVLKNEMTRLYPVFRTGQNEGKFVATGDVANSTVVVGGESITTSPLKIGMELDLLGISQTQTLLDNGTMDETDSIDPHVILENVYISVTNGTDTDIIKLPTTNIPLSNFTYMPQNNYRMMQLAFETTSIVLNASTTQVDGSAPVVLAALASDNYVMRLKVKMTGSVNIETGATSVYGNTIEIYSLQDTTGAAVDQTSGDGQTIATAIGGGNTTFLGYDLTAWRTNMNRRTRGQILNITFYTQLYSVPLRSPITAIHPVTVDVANDTTSLTALITATHIRTSNDAVTSLIDAASLLQQYASSPAIGQNLEGPQLLGVGRFLVKPYYKELPVDVSTQINTLRSAQRVEDIQGLLVNYIRDQAYRMYRDSEYMAAARAMSGGATPPPTVIVGTDPVLARYLTVTGDLRTLGNDFKVRIVQTLDSRVKGKIYVTFGDFNGDVNAAPNPLHWGVMAWKPELTLTLPISRGGQMSKELTVQPSYLHIVNCPILAVLNVSNIPDALNSVAVQMHSV